MVSVRFFACIITYNFRKIKDEFKYRTAPVREAVGTVRCLTSLVLFQVVLNLNLQNNAGLDQLLKGFLVHTDRLQCATDNDNRKREPRDAVSLLRRADTAHSKLPNCLRI